MLTCGGDIVGKFGRFRKTGVDLIEYSSKSPPRVSLLKLSPFGEYISIFFRP